MKQNKSKVYILPLIIQKLPIVHKNIRNTYVFYKDSEFKLHIDVKLSDYEKKYVEKFEYYSSHVELSEGFVLISLNIPENFKRDYVLFLRGKYSLFSNEAKEIVKYYYQLQSKKGVFKNEVNVNDVFTKNIKLKEKLENTIGTKLPEGSELLSIINIKEETYNES